MNVLWTKGKLHRIFSKESLTVHAHASGDGGTAPGRCCRLCGGENSLRNFGDTCVWEGVEESYDQLLFDCFGVRVSPSDCMICEWCVRQLRSTERFKALVHAAFDRPFSEHSSKHSIKLNEPTTRLPKEISIKDPQIRTELRMRAHTDQAFKKRDTRKKVNPVPVKHHRANIACAVCGQKYPMIVPTEEVEKGGVKFVCSRCKKNGGKGDICRRCNIVMPSNMFRDHQALHVKADLRGKSRLPKKPLQVKLVDNVLKSHYSPKKEGKQRPGNSLYLSHNLNAIHEESTNHLLCSICEKVFRNRKSLDKHLKAHPDEALYQCRTCLTAFKSKHSLQTHSLQSHKTPKCSS